MNVANPNFLSVGIFVFRETRKFLFTLQARQIAYIWLQKVLDCTLFSSIWIAFWLQTPNGGLTALPLPSNCCNVSLNPHGSLLKRKFEPCIITAVLLQMKSKCTFSGHLQIDKKTNNVHKNRSKRKNWSKLWLWGFSKKESYVVHISFSATRDWNSR